MAKFAITAVVTEYTYDDKGEVKWTHPEQLPTFFVDGAVQGFFSEAGAAEIARRVIDPFGHYSPLLQRPWGDLTITATEV